MQTVPLNQLPANWQQYFHQINERVLLLEQIQVGLIVVIVALLVIIAVAYFLDRTKGNAPAPRPMTSTGNPHAHLTLINVLLAHDSTNLVDHLRRGIAVFDGVVLVSSAIVIRLDRNTVDAAASDARLRGMIIEDVKSGNGVAYRVTRGEVTSLAIMDRAEFLDWQSRHAAAATT